MLTETMADDLITEAELVDEPGTDLVHHPARADVATITTTALMRPVGDVDQIVEAFTQYQSLRRRLIVASDVQNIQGKEFVKKSGWRKIATAFGLNVEYRDETLAVDEYANVTNARVHARAIAPNGRYFDAVGVCDRYERCCRERLGKDECKIRYNKHYHCTVGCDGLNHFSKPQHDIPATAATRAANRAIADLVGFGEVSFEEVDRDVGEPVTAADVDEIVGALNRIEDEQQRKAAKIAFVNNFGKPADLTTDRLDHARTWITSAGGSFVPAAPTGGTGPPAGTRAPQPAAPPADGGLAAGETPPDVIVADHGQSVSPPSAEDTSTAAVQSGTVEATGSEEPAGTNPEQPVPPPEFDGPPAAANQKRDIAIACQQLGIDHSDKEMIAMLVTHGRTSTTTRMSKAEAAAMLAAMRQLKAETIALDDSVIDDLVVRLLVPRNKVGESWLAPYVNGEEP